MLGDIHTGTTTISLSTKLWYGQLSEEWKNPG